MTMMKSKKKMIFASKFNENLFKLIKIASILIIFSFDQVTRLLKADGLLEVRPPAFGGFAQSNYKFSADSPTLGFEDSFEDLATIRIRQLAQRGSTILMAAVRFSSRDVVKALVDCGAAMSTEDDGFENVTDYVAHRWRATSLLVSETPRSDPRYARLVARLEYDRELERDVLLNYEFRKLQEKNRLEPGNPQYRRFLQKHNI